MVYLYDTVDDLELLKRILGVGVVDQPVRDIDNAARSDGNGSLDDVIARLHLQRSIGCLAQHDEVFGRRTVYIQTLERESGIGLEIGIGGKHDIGWLGLIDAAQLYGIGSEIEYTRKRVVATGHEVVDQRLAHRVGGARMRLKPLFQIAFGNRHIGRCEGIESLLGDSRLAVAGLLVAHRPDGEYVIGVFLTVERDGAAVYHTVGHDRFLTLGSVVERHFIAAGPINHFPCDGLRLAVGTRSDRDAVDLRSFQRDARDSA